MALAQHETQNREKQNAKSAVYKQSFGFTSEFDSITFASFFYKKFETKRKQYTYNTAAKTGHICKTTKLKS